MARTYKRDSRGRFAGGGGGGGGGGGRPAARKAPRGTNRLTRDNAGRITGTGNGATARGGRLRTASGGLRATQVAKVKGGGGRLRGRKGNAKNGIRPIDVRQAKNSIRPFSVKSKRNSQLTESKRKIAKFTRQAMRLQRNYSVARKDVSNPKNRRTMRVAERAFAYLKTPRNSIAPSPRRGASGGSAARRR